LIRIEMLAVGESLRANSRRGSAHSPRIINTPMEVFDMGTMPDERPLRLCDVAARVKQLLRLGALRVGANFCKSVNSSNEASVSKFHCADLLAFGDLRESLEVKRASFLVIIR